MKLNGEQIAAARMLAESVAPNQLESLCLIDWNRTNKDKRRGSVHAWNWSKLGRVYLGQYKNHATAIEYGANVTKFAGRWFLWSPKIMYAIASECPNPPEAG